MDIKIQNIEKTKLNRNNKYFIKSLYNLKEILSFFNENQKLEIIIYNKELQKEFGIDIDNYKKISGKYKVAGRNSKGIEYKLNTDIIIFEGK